MHMYYVYILKSVKDGGMYIGYTADLRKRFKEHQLGLNPSTKYKRPWQIVYYEAYKSRSDSRYREYNLKRFAKGYAQLKRRIKNSLQFDK